MASQMIASSGVHLSVRGSGLAHGPTIILVHGFPDNQQVWDLVVPLLEPHFHVVTYDVRGAGESSAPSQRKGYRMGCLVEDLIAVVERVRPDGGPVHLVGHDWGSVQLWAAVMKEATDERLSGRIASFTSISGPGLALFGHFVASSVRRREIAALARQAGRSWYILMFQLPWLPEFIFRRFGGSVRRLLVRKQRLQASAHWANSFNTDGANGVNLYRQNGLTFRTAATTVPVQLIVPTKDAFLTPAVYADAAEFAPDLERTEITADHWVVRTHPDAIAAKIQAFAEARS